MESEKLYDLEKRIRQSKDLVVASDTLRARVVSEILRRHSGQEVTGKLYRVCCVLLICHACILMSVRSMDRWWNEHYQPVSSSDILRKAKQIQEQNHLEPTESLAEAYSQWKSQLANHWKAGSKGEPIQ